MGIMPGKNASLIEGKDEEEIIPSVILEQLKKLWFHIKIKNKKNQLIYLLQIFCYKIFFHFYCKRVSTLHFIFPGIIIQYFYFIIIIIIIIFC